MLKVPVITITIAITIHHLYGKFGDKKKKKVPKDSLSVITVITIHHLHGKLGEKKGIKGPSNHHNYCHHYLPLTVSIIFLMCFD